PRRPPLLSREPAVTVHDSGATSVEYALMVTLIAGVIVPGVLVFGQAVLGLFQPAVDFFSSLSP
ncbi:MAG: Flp family type IVb pilin, partial [Actinomycetes bacterium]